MSDTDGDFVIDTGPIPAGGSKTIKARYEVPPGTEVGDNNVDQIQFTSSINNAVKGTVQLYMSVPAGFANVFVNNTDGAMSFLTAYSGGTNLRKATANNYFGSDIAVAELTNGNYFYAWDKGYTVGSSSARDIEFVIVNRSGGVVRATTKLTNNASASMLTLDSLPSIAVAPDGTVGVAWRRYIFDDSKDKFNYNILFATLDKAGHLLRDPINITNNSNWGTSETFDLPLYDRPTIASTSDNRFVMAWQDDRHVSSSTTTYNVGIAVRMSSATGVLSARVMTTDDKSWGPTVNSLADGKAIVTWHSTEDKGPYYAIISNNGSLSKFGTNLDAGTRYGAPDVVQLPNGEAAVAWTTDTGVQFSILNSSYNIGSGPHTANSPSSIPGRNLSVTSDPFNHVIMTWIDQGTSNRQLYALGDSNGAYLTAPMVYNSSKDGMSVSWNGEGSAPFQGKLIISGNVGVAGATLTFPGGSTTSSSSGDYALRVPFGWSGTVTPSKTGYIFFPTKRTYSNITTDQTTQNYTATHVYLISGNAGVADAKLSYTDVVAKTATSQQNGDYSFVVSANWTGTVTPAHPCFTFSPPNKSYTNLASDQTSQNYTPAVKAGSGCADIDVNIRGINQGRYGVPPHTGARASFTNVDRGPVEITSNNSLSLIGAARLIYKVDNIATSFSEIMGLPNSQVDTVYWLPWYNNKGLNSQLRIANLGGTSANVQVKIGGVNMGSFSVGSGAVALKSYPGIDRGPVKIKSDQNLVVAERIIYKVNGKATSFWEMMALPANQVDTAYWLPWYNNKTMDTQLRIGNASTNPASVRVWIGVTEVTGSPFTIPVNGSIRKNFAGIATGPVKIESTQDIVVSERVIYKTAGGVPVSLSETMGLPNSQVDTVYWLPWYNSKGLNSQLRIANISQTDANVHVFAGGAEVTGSPFTVLAGQAITKIFPGIDKGPLQIVSDQNIVVSECIIYKINQVVTSFSEMTALPDGSLDTSYWLPWYNNKSLDTQLRFSVP